MTIHAAPDAIAAFLLALVRVSAWMSISPPFGSRVIPARAKLMCAIGLAIVTTPHLDTAIPLDTAGFTGAVLTQAFAGVALGLIGLILFSAVQAAGSLIDLFGGFTIDQAYDPFGNASSTVFGRFYQLLALVLLFAIDGHLLLVRGFIASFDAVPARGLGLAALSQLFTHDLGAFFVAALEIAAPLVGVLFLAEVGLGLLSKAAPQLNVLQLGFPLKILFTLLVMVVALKAMPERIDALVGNMLREMGKVARIVPGG